MLSCAGLLPTSHNPAAASASPSRTRPVNRSGVKPYTRINVAAVRPRCAHMTNSSRRRCSGIAPRRSAAGRSKWRAGAQRAGLTLRRRLVGTAFQRARRFVCRFLRQSKCT
jgi:hypothetical protein